MRKYETPDMDVIYFDAQDVIATSGLGEGEVPPPDWD